MARNLADLSLFQLSPAAVQARQQEADRQIMQRDDLFSGGFALGRLFGGDDARAEQVANAIQNQTVVTNRLFQNPDRPDIAYRQAGEDFMKMKQPELAQQFFERANKAGLQQKQLSMAQERLDLAKGKTPSERVFTMPKPTRTQKKGIDTFLKQQGIIGELDAPGMSSDITAEESVRDLIASMENEYLARMKQREVPPLGLAQIRANAFQELQNQGVIRFVEEQFGDNWDFNEEAFNRFVGVRKPVADDDPRIKQFMKANPSIKSREEAIRVLQEAGRL
jgi:hypothetical protein